MKLVTRILGLIFTIALISSCSKEEIITFSEENSAVNFQSTSYQFSLKGLTEPSVLVKVPFNLVGPATDFDREVSFKILEGASTTASEGVNFSFPNKVIVKAGELSGTIEMTLNAFKGDETRFSVALQFEPNEWFRVGYPSLQKTLVSWSEEYVRPQTGVFRYWYLFFCNGYSQNLHKLIVQEFGEEIESYTASNSYVKQDPTLTYKGINYWYACSRQLREAVKQHDAEHPDDPYMHSDDFEAYSSYTTPIGQGTATKPVPTILETLLAL